MPVTQEIRWETAWMGAWQRCGAVSELVVLRKASSREPSGFSHSLSPLRGQGASRNVKDSWGFLTRFSILDKSKQRQLNGTQS